jgi:hypothetical protein
VLAIAVAAVETVNVVVAAVVPETVTDAGLKLHEAFIGRPVQEKLTVPPNPAAPATLTCVVVVSPEVTVSEVEAPLPGPTVTGASTVCVNDPLAAELFASPLYAAEIAWLPAVEKFALKVATPAVTVAVPSDVVPSEKTTEPPGPANKLVIVAVSVTSCPV